ncbi:MAG: hypothetical protein ACRDN6_03850 [Gaiellaceae bacterium]
MVPTGPLAVRWLGCEVGAIRAGTLLSAAIELENAGSATWRSRGNAGVKASYHWLDERGNPIVWDGLRTSLDRTVAPGERISAAVVLRAPIPPGRYRLAFDLVDEGRAWFAELGSATLEREADVAPRIERRLAARGGDPAALAGQEEPLVPEEEAEAIAHLGANVAPAPDWSRRVLDAHQEGYAAVGGSIEAAKGLLGRAPRALEPWAPGTGRVPGFQHPLLCPSLVRGVEPEWLEEVEGLPALRPPAGEPWLYDGRITARLARSS